MYCYHAVTANTPSQVPCDKRLNRSLNVMEQNIIPTEVNIVAKK